MKNRIFHFKSERGSHVFFKKSCYTKEKMKKVTDFARI